MACQAEALQSNAKDGAPDPPSFVQDTRQTSARSTGTATPLLEKERIRRAPLFTHLALEKALKAHVCRHSGDLAPRTHNPVRLAEVAAHEPTTARVQVLSMVNEFSQAGRCPDGLVPLPTLDQSSVLIELARRAEQVVLPDAA
jgi:HEPN domain-containing protein